MSEFLKDWLPDRDEDKPYMDGLYCFTDQTPQGRAGVAWVIRGKDAKGHTYWFCFKHQSRDCDDATRATLASIKQSKPGA